MIPLLTEDVTEQTELLNNVLLEEFRREGMNAFEQQLALTFGIVSEFNVVRLLLVDHLQKNGFTASNANLLLQTLQEEHLAKVLSSAIMGKPQIKRGDLIIRIANEIITHFNSLQHN